MCGPGNNKIKEEYRILCRLMSPVSVSISGVLSASEIQSKKIKINKNNKKNKKTKNIKEEGRFTPRQFV